MGETRINGNSKHIVGLDILRGVSLLMVFFGHAKDFFLPLSPKVGYIGAVAKGGLDFFFSLSGFLIGIILINQFEQPADWKRKLLRFFKRRWFRTLPLYYLGIMINLAAGVFITGNYFDFSWKFLVFSQNLHEALFFFFPISYSLSIEEWFYVFFPVLLIAMVMLFRKKVSQLLIFFSIAVIILAILVRYYAYSNGPVHWEAEMRKAVMYRADACVYGTLLAGIFHFKKALLLRLKWLLFVTGILLYGVALLYYLLQYESIMNYVFYFTIVPVAFSLMIPLFYAIPDTRLRVVKVMVWLSAISYPLYIIHLNPVMEIVMRYITISSWMQAWVVFIVYTTICVLLASVLHKYIELPFMRYGKR
jgi:peptidoglycan/LPS O-acetylase OafA/YrhL